jgi:hypothetical protein
VVIPSEGIEYVHFIVVFSDSSVGVFSFYFLDSVYDNILLYLFVGISTSSEIVVGIFLVDAS